MCGFRVRAYRIADTQCVFFEIRLNTEGFFRARTKLIGTWMREESMYAEAV